MSYGVNCLGVFVASVVGVEEEGIGDEAEASCHFLMVFTTLTYSYKYSFLISIISLTTSQMVLSSEM